MSSVWLHCTFFSISQTNTQTDTHKYSCTSAVSSSYFAIALLIKNVKSDAGVDESMLACLFPIPLCVYGHVCDTCSVSISAAAALLALRRPNFTYMLYNKQHYRRYRQSHWKGTLDIVSLMFVLLQGCAWRLALLKCISASGIILHLVSVYLC